MTEQQARERAEAIIAGAPYDSAGIRDDALLIEGIVAALLETFTAGKCHGWNERADGEEAREI